MTPRRVVRLARLLGHLCLVLVLAGCSKPTQPYSPPVYTDFGGVWGTSGTDVYVVGMWFDQASKPHSLILHYDGRQWSALLPGTRAYLTCMWGSSTEQFIVGSVPLESGWILHRSYNDGRWNTEISRVNQELVGVWGSSPNNVFAAGGQRFDHGVILHYDGNTWSTQVDTVNAKAVWGNTAGDVFAVGTSILHYDGSSWNTQLSRAGSLSGVWGSSGSDVFAVGGYGTILHNDGNGWSSQMSGTTAILVDVWGTSGSDVFVVGLEGTILHYDGNSWTRQTSGTRGDLIGVWGSSGSDVFAVGYEGTLLHYNGRVWSAVRWQSPSLGLP
jgi:hypothetical protein